MLSDIRTGLDIVHVMDKLLGESLIIDAKKLEKKALKMEGKIRTAIQELAHGARSKRQSMMYM